jgi:hypothetical protein
MAGREERSSILQRGWREEGIGGKAYLENVRDSLSYFNVLSSLHLMGTWTLAPLGEFLQTGVMLPVIPEHVTMTSLSSRA